MHARPTVHAYSTACTFAHTLCVALSTIIVKRFSNVFEFSEKDTETAKRAEETQSETGAATRRGREARKKGGARCRESSYSRSQVVHDLLRCRPTPSVPSPPARPLPYSISARGTRAASASHFKQEAREKKVPPIHNSRPSLCTGNAAVSVVFGSLRR